MALSAEERRAAAAARRQKVLSRGDSRMAQVTGTIAKPSHPESLQVQSVPSSDSEDMVPPVASASNVSAMSESASEPFPPPSAIPNRSDATAVPSGPLKGTAAGDKWTGYTSIKAAVSKKRRVLTAVERLDVTVRSTALLRLFLAILLGVVLYTAWELASAEAPSNFSIAWQERSLRKLIGKVERYGWLHMLQPIARQFKYVMELKAIKLLKQPQWAVAVAAAEKYPSRILLAMNAFVLMSTYLFLWLGGSRARAVHVTQQSTVLWRMIGMLVPGLKEQLAHFGAWQRLISSIIDSGVVFIVTLACFQLAEQLEQ